MKSFLKSVDNDPWFIVCNTPINALMIMALFYGMVDFAQGYFIRQYRSIAESIQLVPQLKMDSYIWKFHTFKRYGITYGKVRLVTFQTFSRFIFFYLKFLIFFFRLNK
ncbi:hypothetical protein BLOT_016142 [Blomia tropicalis]|nr:hypothetical protein BLOT_016142 [Blomia tropicalis]